jgi:hypothetical protein
VLLVGSPLLSILAAAAGAFTIVLGVVHVGIPSILRFSDAIGVDGDQPGLGQVRMPGIKYNLKRADLRGIAWVMSNAASYVLVSVGIIDLAWVSDWRGIPLPIGAAWVAGWWAVRSGGQLLVGRRIGDVAITAWFACLAALHVAIAILEH